MKWGWPLFYRREAPLVQCLFYPWYGPGTMSELPSVRPWYGFLNLNPRAGARWSTPSHESSVHVMLHCRVVPSSAVFRNLPPLVLRSDDLLALPAWRPSASSAPPVFLSVRHPEGAPYFRSNNAGGPSVAEGPSRWARAWPH
jgi:hypothetical protein